MPVRFIHWFVGDKLDNDILLVCFVCKTTAEGEIIVFYTLLPMPYDDKSLCLDYGDYIWCATKAHGTLLLQTFAFRLMLEKFNFFFPKPYSNVIAEVDDDGLLTKFIKQPTYYDALTKMPIDAKLASVKNQLFIDHAKSSVSDYENYTIGSVIVSYLHTAKFEPTITEYTCNSKRKNLSSVSLPCKNNYVRDFLSRGAGKKLQILTEADVILVNSGNYNCGHSAVFSFCKQRLYWKCMSYKGPEMYLLAKKSFNNHPTFINSPQPIFTDTFPKTYFETYLGFWVDNFHTAFARAFTTTTTTTTTTTDKDDYPSSQRTIKDALTDIFPKQKSAGYFYTKYNKKVMENVYLYKYDFSNFLPQILLSIIDDDDNYYTLSFVLKRLLQNCNADHKKIIKKTLTAICGYLKWTDLALFRSMTSKAQQYMLNAVQSIEEKSFEVVLIAYDGFIIKSTDDDEPDIIGCFDIPLKFEGFFTDAFFLSVNQTILINRHENQIEVRGIWSEKHGSKIVRFFSLQVLRYLCYKRLGINISFLLQPDWEKVPLEDFAFASKRSSNTFASSIVENGFSTKGSNSDFFYGKTLQVGGIPTAVLDLYGENDAICFSPSKKKVINYPRYVHLTFQNIKIFNSFFSPSSSETFSNVYSECLQKAKRTLDETALYRLPTHPIELLRCENKRDLLLKRCQAIFSF